MRPAAAFAMLLLVGCAGGSSVGPPGDTSSTAGNLTTTAHPQHATAGQTFQFTITVTGPTDYEAGCVQTVHLWAETADSAARRVWEQPVPQVECMAIIIQHLGAGQSVSFRVDWPTTGIPRAAYYIHGLFRFALPAGAGTRVRENIPPVMVTVG